MNEPQITVRKHTAVVLMNEEDAAEAEALAVHLRGVLDGSIKLPPSFDPGPNPIWLRLMEAAAGQPLLTKLLELHTAKGVAWGKADGMPPHIAWQCMGDEYNGYDAEPADWPCETVTVIADHLGVEVGAS